MDKIVRLKDNTRKVYKSKQEAAEHNKTTSKSIKRAIETMSKLAGAYWLKQSND